MRLNNREIDFEKRIAKLLDFYAQISSKEVLKMKKGSDCTKKVLLRHETKEIDSLEKKSSSV